MQSFAGNIVWRVRFDLKEISFCVRWRTSKALSDLNGKSYLSVDFESFAFGEVGSVHAGTGIQHAFLDR